MLSVQELRRLATGLDSGAFEKQLGPFVLVQRPPDAVVQQRALQLGAARTMAVKPNHKTDTLQLLLEFDTLQIATLPPLESLDVLTVGRLPDCELVIDDPSVSKHHARLFWLQEAQHAEVADLGSSNGTEVNGVLLTSGHVLKDGDEVCFGDARFCYLRTPSLHERLRSTVR